jgi:hypothetical protein
MRRLTKQERADLEKRLAEWQPPEAMRSAVEKAMDLMGSKNLFTQGGLAFLQDAWIAGQLAHLRDADQVRIVQDNWPDFELKFGDRNEQFEAVEADAPKRRRGDEFSNSSVGPQHDREEDWAERATQAPSWIKHACIKKANKNYSARAHLVVYLNLSEYGTRQKEVASSFQAATAPAKDAFASIWVLWKEQVYPVWKDGLIQPQA